jgi:alkaline phosphatase
MSTWEVERPAAKPEDNCIPSTGGHDPSLAWSDFVVPFTQSVPTLIEMTRAALNVLDNDPDGFLLMTEGGAVDWAAHAGQSGRLIEEQHDFDETVEAVVDWVSRRTATGARRCSSSRATTRRAT